MSTGQGIRLLEAQSLLFLELVAPQREAMAREERLVRSLEEQSLRLERPHGRPGRALESAEEQSLRVW